MSWNFFRSLTLPCGCQIHGLSKKYPDYRNISRKGRATLIKFGVHLEGTLPDIHARALSCASIQSAMAYLWVEGCWGCPSHFRFSSNAFATALTMAVEDVWMGKNVVEDDWWVHMSRIKIKTGCQCSRSSCKLIASVSVSVRRSIRPPQKAEHFVSSTLWMNSMPSLNNRHWYFSWISFKCHLWRPFHLYFFSFLIFHLIFSN